MSEVKISPENYSVVVKSAVKLYRQALSKTKNRDDGTLRRCALAAAHSKYLLSVIALRWAKQRTVGEVRNEEERAQYELFAHQLQRSNDTIVEVMMAVARIEDEKGKENAAEDVEGLIQYAYIDFSMRCMLM